MVICFRALILPETSRAMDTRLGAIQTSFRNSAQRMETAEGAGAEEEVEASLPEASLSCAGSSFPEGCWARGLDDSGRIVTWCW